ncbi:hypothetical protein SAMN05443575_2121 [Jatrophihabitans endophyticus]|uniref:Excreted virulence factor EspC, type VII ESX diderm n=1 Tax=Jatrophihabitans endophyticus TaxID=1206085 RepID=A0A1M5KF18_9ACTN|nr:hypothetical protein [Jatrophihabitans endophyticus]SHG50773.1 hypothetical protein SAMN05443575_2121 [Jatrophihabitans endophyticus]
MGGSGETIIPEALIQLANQLDDAVGPELDRAKASFEAAEISGDKFSQAGLSLQVVYPGTREWAIADAQSKHDELRAITDKLAATATLWARAESDNTIVEI